MGCHPAIMKMNKLLHTAVQMNLMNIMLNKQAGYQSTYCHFIYIKFKTRQNFSMVFNSGWLPLERKVSNFRRHGIWGSLVLCEHLLGCILCIETDLHNIQNDGSISSEKGKLKQMLKSLMPVDSEQKGWEDGTEGIAKGHKPRKKGVFDH